MDKAARTELVEAGSFPPSADHSTCSTTRIVDLQNRVQTAKDERAQHVRSGLHRTPAPWAGSLPTLWLH
jgi:hypothetical protein